MKDPGFTLGRILVKGKSLVYALDLDEVHVATQDCLNFSKVRLRSENGNYLADSRNILPLKLYDILILSKLL